MSFLLQCPNCGPRDVAEFACAGEISIRPTTAPTRRELSSYLYFRRNVAGMQEEWWYHRLGCEGWFTARRDTRTNEVSSTALPQARRADGTPGPQEAALPDAPAV